MQQQCFPNDMSLQYDDHHDSAKVMYACNKHVFHLIEWQCNQKGTSLEV